MKNITVKVDDETYRRARVLAAGRETSVSAMVREFLQSLIGESQGENEQARIAARRRRLQKLWEMADRRDAGKAGPAGPFKREEIYEERLR